ncbi:MAG TPA: class I adenylate-forming enzyme family protein [Pseudonocardia sp.]|nr:class I adenylate-forming enzyme family protein [Pseudonocardia sp.]
MGERAPEGSLANLLAWRLAEGPDRGFLHVEDDGPWSYARLAAASVALGDRLGDRLGAVAPGARVVVRVGNDERFLPAVCAVWGRRAAAVVMHPAAPAEEVARVVAAMGATAVVCGADDPAALPGVVGVPVVAFDRFSPSDGPEGPGESVSGATGGGSGPAGSGRYRPPEEDVGGEAALVLLTSGSTGEPKGVVLTHDNAWSNLRATVSAFRRDTGPTPLADPGKPPNLIANPLSHTAGVVRLLFALYVGRSVALLRKFDGRTAKRLLDRHGIDNLTINPAMLRILLDTLEPGEDLGAVRYVSSGTAPLTPALREEFEARFGVPVLQAYGQTEAFGGISIESARDVLAGRRRPGSVGRPLPGVELRLVTADGAEAATGQEGEIRVRSRSATAGYLGAATDSPLDADGWLRTGDLGRLDDDGYLYLTGRLKNIIIRGGFNVVPEEVEAALAADPAVREAAVLGVPDDRLGEVPVALVVPDPAVPATAEAVLAAVRPRLAPYKRPDRVFLLAELPRVPNGKVDRPRAAALARALAAEATGAVR